MSAAIGCLFRSRVARCGAALLLMSVLAGCAAASGRRTSSWSQEGPRFGVPLVPAPKRLALAMSDGPISGGEPTGPAVEGYNVPGRNPDSQVPWELFLGNAAHRMIAYVYGVNHPRSVAYYNTETLNVILAKTGLGDASRLLLDERNLRPDITDTTLRILFEIKPWSEQGLREGREEALTYLSALNRALLAGKRFTAGTDFHGETLIRFAGGQYIWRLEWKTTEPGVVQYRWTRSQQRFESEVAAYKAGQWVELTEQELRQYGGWVAQAVDGLVSRREKLASISGAIGIAIDLIGDAATVVFWGSILGQLNSGTGTRQPPAQGGGQVIPFPVRSPPTAPTAKMPTAVGL